MLEAELHSIVRGEFSHDPSAPVLLRLFLEEERYRPAFLERLAAIAAGRRGASWELRRATVLMLENQFLRTPQSDERECAALLETVGVGRHPRRSLAELRSRMTRLARVHQGIRGHATSPEALTDFLHVARHDCKLTLAPCFFSAEEVAARIASLVRLSQGLPYWEPRGGEGVRDLGDYERRILEILSFGSCTYWTDDQTPSTINSLVEYPIGTVALVIKLPGSDHEFELKRAGVRGKQPLSVRYYRAAHRLYGGNPGTSSDVEARAALRLAEIFRAVHDRDPPISTTISMSCVQTVPAWAGDAHVLQYFTDRQIFGDGYDAMRRAMADAVRDFEDGARPLDLPGPLGLTIRFLRFMPPRQAVLKGCTSFRLDTLQDYLSADGPREYFRKGLGRDYTFDDARRFADDLLEEILGVYVPPGETGSYQDYIRQALAVPANRRRADRLYIKHLRETGMLWGTLIATSGFSRGESFVPRNVGLKSRWRDGEWAVDIVFMDHDILQIPGNRKRSFDPQYSVSGMQIDEGYMWGGDPNKGQSPGVEGCLRQIYDVSKDIQSEGIAAFHTAVAEAYRTTRRMMVESPDVRTLFDDDFIEKIALWESLLWNRLQAQARGVTHETWTASASQLLRAAGCGPRMTDEWTRAASRAATFLDRYADVFDPGYLDFSRSRTQPAG